MGLESIGSAYLGIVVEDSIRDRAAMERLRVLATRHLGSWAFALVRIPAMDLPETIARLQRGMVTDDTWYNHFFRDEDLVVVFRDAVFSVTTDPASWAPAVAHGLAGGIPSQQLDFHPRTPDAAEAFFRDR
jgi:hypothetical protein